jgi:hypothetical protein
MTFNNNTFKIASTGMKGFVASHQLSMEWSDIEDMESGIHTIEIGIGSSNMSADIVQFAEYVSYAQIDMHDCFQDGHQYFAILLFTSIIPTSGDVLS